MKQTRKALFVLLALVFLYISLFAGLAVVSHSCCEVQSQNACLECALLQLTAGVLAVIAAWAMLPLLLPAMRRASEPHSPTLVLLKMRMNN